MGRKVLVALVIGGVALGVGMAVLAPRSSTTPPRNAPFEEERKKQVERCWQDARRMCGKRCREEAEPEIAAMMDELAKKGGDEPLGDAVVGYRAGRDMQKALDACTETCARIEVQQRGEDCVSP